MIFEAFHQVEILVLENPIFHKIGERVVLALEKHNDLGGEGFSEDRQHGELGMDNGIGAPGFGSRQHRIG